MAAIGDPAPMIELLGLLLATLVGTLSSRQRLFLANLLLRQQVQVALRCPRPPRLRTRDKLFWLVVRRLHRNWRRHLLLVRPETLLRWHRQGWRYFERLKLGIAVSYHEARPHQGLGQRRAQPTGGRAPPPRMAGWTAVIAWVACSTTTAELPDEVTLLG